MCYCSFFNKLLTCFPCEPNSVKGMRSLWICQSNLPKRQLWLSLSRIRSCLCAESEKVATFKNMYVFSNNCWYIPRIFHLPCHHVVVNLRCVVHETIFYSPAGRLSGIIGNKTELLRRSTCKIGSFFIHESELRERERDKGSYRRQILRHERNIYLSECKSFLLLIRTW